MKLYNLKISFKTRYYTLKDNARYVFQTPLKGAVSHRANSGGTAYGGHSESPWWVGKLDMQSCSAGVIVIWQTPS